MIIYIQSPTADNLEVARSSLEAMAHGWGHDVADAPAEAAPSADHDAGKAIDPVTLASLVLSIPSAALAVFDLGDRIQKRRRAKELIGHAQQLAAQQTTLLLTHHSRTIEIRALDPDQLLDILDGDDESS